MINTLKANASEQRGCFRTCSPSYYYVMLVVGLVDMVISCRTQDKAILESAYNANPKPDKAARLDIVKRVSLNEKEVQVSLSIALGRCINASIANQLLSELTRLLLS